MVSCKNKEGYLKFPINGKTGAKFELKNSTKLSLVFINLKFAGI